jgi:hypothetical protein
MHCRFILLIYTSVLLASFVGAQAGPTVPGTSWVYPYIDEIRLIEPVPPFFVMTGPYERLDLARWLARIEATPAPNWRARWLRGMLRKEFAPEEEFAHDGDFVLVGDALASAYIEREGRFRPGALVGFTAYGRNGLDLWTGFRVTRGGEADHKTQAVEWRDGARASFDYGGLEYRHGIVSVFLGRDEVSWGASRNRGLLFSGSGHSLDMLRFTLATPLLRFTAFQAQLRRGASDPWAESIKRYVAAHRVEVLVSKTFNFSFSEAVLYGGEGRDFQLGYSLPMAAFYAEQWNSEEEDNILIGSGFGLVFPGCAEVRGEVLFDDFQIDPGSEPNEVGLGLEVRAVNPLVRVGSVLGLSYHLVTNRTYGHKVSWNRFVQEGVLIGYPDGPDGDRLGASASFALGEPYWLKISYERVRQGEGRVSDPQEEPGRHLRFPSGIVETKNSFLAELAWRPCWPLYVTADLGWSRAENVGNREGVDHDGFNLALGIQYFLRLTEATTLEQFNR